MPLYFRKRPGSKNVKANITQRGLRSLTFTTGSKKGRPRLNFNTSRGWSLSIPGTGFVWRQKGYGNSQYKSVVEERGYDLRTKEGRLKAEEESNSNIFIYLVVGIGLTVGWFSGDRFYGFLASYLTFFLFLPFGTNSGPGTYVWATLAHVFGGFGYGVSWIFSTDWLEPTVIGVIVGTIFSSIILNGLALTAFVVFLLSGLWAFIGEPSLYLTDFFERLSHHLNAALTDIFATRLNQKQSAVSESLGSLSSGVPGQLNFFLNAVGIVCWITNILGASFMTFLNVKRSSLSIFSKLCLAPISFAALVLTFTLSIVMVEALLSDKSDFTLHSRPSILASSIIFSVCVGYFLSRIYARQNNTTHGPLNPFIASLLGIFWLPLLASKKPQIAIEADKNEFIARETANDSTKQFEVQLQSVIGLGKKRREKILMYFPTPELLLAADSQTILLKTGVGKTVLERIRKIL